MPDFESNEMSTHGIFNIELNFILTVSIFLLSYVTIITVLTITISTILPPVYSSNICISVLHKQGAYLRRYRHGRRQILRIFLFNRTKI